MVALPANCADEALTRRALRHALDGTTDMADAVLKVPLHYYRDPKITEIEETQILENDVAKEGSETLEQVLAALKVFNRQTSGEGQRLQQSTKKSQEAYANTVTEQMRRERLVAIKENYSYETGQGPNACAQVAFLQKVTGAIDGTGSSTSRVYKQIASWLKEATPS